MIFLIWLYLIKGLDVCVCVGGGGGEEDSASFKSFPLCEI